MTLPSALRIPAKMVNEQFIVFSGIVLAVFALFGFSKGISFFAGAMTAWVPFRLVVSRLFSTFPKPKQFLARFMRNEILRIIGTAVLFVLVLRFFPIETIPSLLGFIGVIFLHPFFSLRTLSRTI